MINMQAEKLTSLVTRQKLAVELYDAFYKYTETFEEDNVLTASLVYLLGAVLKGTSVELDVEREDTFYGFLADVFPKTHKIWTHITIADS